MSVSLERRFLNLQLRRSRKHNKSGDNNGQWTYYGSDIEAYEAVFKTLLPDTSIKSFVSQKTSPVVLDIMAPSDTLKSLFKDLGQKDKLGIAVSLSDLRSAERKKADTDLGIHQIAGDITRPYTWDRVNAELKGRKADLIMERGGLGVSFVPDDIRFYAMMINKMWDLLTFDNGMILVQARYDARYDRILARWIKHLNRKGIKTSFAVDGFHPTMRINKTPNSPGKLPFFESLPIRDRDRYRR